MEALKGKDCPIYLINMIISYFQNRRIVTNSHNTKLEKNLTQGAPQGSCCGPLLWNILLDSIFEIDQVKTRINRDDFYIKAFADDVCIGLAFENDLTQAQVNKFEKQIENILNAIHSWGESHYLNFNVKKTKAMAFKSSAFAKVPIIRMNNETIKLDNLVKYLGIWFDDRLTFKDHALKTIDKCKRIFNIVRSYCGRTWGLNPYLTRLIYKTIIMPVLTYGASIWYPAFMHRDVSVKIRTLQYYCTKSIVKSYRTASIVSTSLLSNTLPLESEIYTRAQIELSRITGAIQTGVFEGNLVSKGTYKPQYYYGALLGKFSEEENFVRTQNKNDFPLGNPETLTVEPIVRWADLPIGPEKAQFETICDLTRLQKRYDYYVFTDGSSVMDLGTGGSFVVKTKTEAAAIESQALPMHRLCTAFQSEMHAIYQGLVWAHHNLDIEDKELAICTDSLSSIQKLSRNTDDSLLAVLINDSLTKITSHKCKITFIKVPAHQEERLKAIEPESDEAFLIQGNIDADFLAKIAAELSKANEEPMYSFISLSIVKRHIKTQLRGAWLAKAYDPKFTDDRAPLNQWIKNFIPNPSYIDSKLLTLCDYYTSQIVIGHGCFKSYLKRFKIANDDLCIRCKNKPDSPEHILFECNRKYTNTLKEMKISKPSELCKILKSDKHQSSEERMEIFKDLCKTIITERRELLSSSSELSEKKKLIKTKPVAKTENKSRKKPVRNPTLFSQYNAERPVKTIDKTNRSPSKKSQANKLTRTEVCAKHGISESNWLTDEHIYKFAQKYQSKLNKFNVLIMSTPIYQNDNQIAGFLKNHLTSRIQVILAIILTNSHWILGMINLNSNLIAILDSMGGERHEGNFRRLLMIARMSLYGLGRNHDPKNFKFFLSMDNPKQENHNDCGVFLCKYTKNILTKDSRKFRIKTGEYRADIAQVLDNSWQIREQPRPNSLSKRPADLLRKDNFINELNEAAIEITHQDYSQLVKIFH